jgi:transcriptional regulator with XRE-family HTH domain
MPESEKSTHLFGERLRALRKKMELKQSAFAHLMGTSDETLCLIEKGRKLPSLKMLCALSEQIGMTLSQLLDFQDEPKTRKSANQPLSALNLYLKTKLPAEVRLIHDLAKSVLNKAPSIYQKPHRKPFVMRDK